MATDQEKEQLMETLKFTPRNYRIELGAYGGEVYFGTVDRKIYDFFKEKKIDIEQYASSWDEELWEDIPEDLRPFEPGSPYDVGGVHESGATFDDTNTIEVFDENGNPVWSCLLGSTALEEAGVADRKRVKNSISVITQKVLWCSMVLKVKKVYYLAMSSNCVRHLIPSYSKLPTVIMMVGKWFTVLATTAKTLKIMITIPQASGVMLNGLSLVMKNRTKE